MIEMKGTSFSKEKIKKEKVKKANTEAGKAAQW